MTKPTTIPHMIPTASPILLLLVDGEGFSRLLLVDRSVDDEKVGNSSVFSSLVVLASVVVSLLKDLVACKEVVVSPADGIVCIVICKVDVVVVVAGDIVSFSVVEGGPAVVIAVEETLNGFFFKERCKNSKYDGITNMIHNTYASCQRFYNFIY